MKNLTKILALLVAVLMLIGLGLFKRLRVHFADVL